MSSELNIMEGPLREMSNAERWYAAVSACDVCEDALQAIELLSMLGLIEELPEGGGHRAVGEERPGGQWYPPSPFIRPLARAKHAR